MTTRSTARKSKRGLCKTPHCRNLARSAGRHECHKCAMRAWRAANPFQAAFATLRDHARGRGIPFTISFNEFREFAERSDYIILKSNKADGLTVDRKDNLLGYVPGNIQPMTRSENSVKRCKQDMMRMQAGYSWRAA